MAARFADVGSCLPEAEKSFIPNVVYHVLTSCQLVATSGKWQIVWVAAEFVVLLDEFLMLGINRGRAHRLYEVADLELF